MMVFFSELTQWSSQMPIITAGPKLRAGFILEPVYSTYNTRLIESLMDKDIEDLFGFEAETNDRRKFTDYSNLVGGAAKNET